MMVAIHQKLVMNAGIDGLGLTHQVKAMGNGTTAYSLALAYAIAPGCTYPIA
jgi:hypothetical protein